MRVLVQRVTGARVAVDGEVIAAIGTGLCALVGVTHTDDDSAAMQLADKVWNLRCFDDEDGFMNLPVSEVGGEVLVVSQFTLYGDLSRGRRPSWVAAARPEHAEPLVAAFAERLGANGASVATGRFGADMLVEIRNDGPVTLMLEVERTAPADHG